MGKKTILHNQYLLGRYPKLGEQSRISFSVDIFTRFIKNSIGITNFTKVTKFYQKAGNGRYSDKKLF